QTGKTPKGDFRIAPSTYPRRATRWVGRICGWAASGRESGHRHASLRREKGYTEMNNELVIFERFPKEMRTHGGRHTYLTWEFVVNGVVLYTCGTYGVSEQWAKKDKERMVALFERALKTN